MKNTFGRMAGVNGSDILPAGTHKLSNSTLKKPVYAVEFCGSDVTITATKDENGSALEQVFVTGSGVALTTNTGLMMFRKDVHEFTCSAEVKVWYSK